MSNESEAIVKDDSVFPLSFAAKDPVALIKLFIKTHTFDSKIDGIDSQVTCKLKFYNFSQGSSETMAVTRAKFDQVLKAFLRVGLDYPSAEEQVSVVMFGLDKVRYGVYVADVLNKSIARQETATDVFTEAAGYKIVAPRTGAIVSPDAAAVFHVQEQKKQKAQQDAQRKADAKRPGGGNSLGWWRPWGRQTKSPPGRAR